MKPRPVSTHTDYTDHTDQLHSLFSRLHPQDVEDFYSSYQQWILQEHLQSLQEQIVTIQQYINENARQMEAFQLSPLAHATLTRLRMHGVEDIDVLDRLLEHDDKWLNHTLELLAQCEHLGFIQENYTQWCEYALEGAYDWITSIHVTDQDMLDNSAEQQTATIQASLTDAAESSLQDSDMLPQVTEEELLQKLMSEEDDDTIKLSSLQAPTRTLQTDDANALEIVQSDVQTNSSAVPIVFATYQPATTTRPLPAITQPLPVVEQHNILEPPQKRSRATTSSSFPSSSVVASPQRGPLWRLFNLLARFFFAT